MGGSQSLLASNNNNSSLKINKKLSIIRKIYENDLNDLYSALPDQSRNFR